jgi:hypothetical protein
MINSQFLYASPLTWGDGKLYTFRRICCTDRAIGVQGWLA